MAGFLFRKSLVTKDEPTLLYFIIDNSDAVQIGDAMYINTDGHAGIATAGIKVTGIVAQVVDKNGIAVDPDSGTTDTYTVESDNETDKMWKVGLICSQDALFSNDADDDLATTNLMQFFNVIDENTIDASDGGDTSGQFQLVSLDPDGDGDASKGLFKIAESQFSPHALA